MSSVQPVTVSITTGDEIDRRRRKFLFLSVEERIGKDGPQGMCQAGLELFKAFCQDEKANLRPFFDHYTDNRCNDCKKAFREHLMNVT